MSTELLKSMLSGMEDLGGGVCSTDSIYASALMGGEGFMDSIKKGANTTIEFIKRVLNTILDAILFYFGGRDNVKRKFDKLKSSKLFSMFKSEISNKVEKITVPAVGIAQRFVEEIIENEYQDFHTNKLKETPEIRAFYVQVNKLSDDLGNYLKATKTKPAEEHLYLDPQLTEVRKCIEAGRKLATSLGKDKEPDQAIIKNINGAVFKLGKATNVMVGAMKSVSKGLDELSKDAESMALFPRSLQTAIDSGSISRVRSAIINEIEDPSTPIADTAKRIAALEKKFPNLYEEYEETTLSKELAPKDTWSEDVYSVQSSFTNANMSKKRMHHLLEIEKYLREQKGKK